MYLAPLSLRRSERLPRRRRRRLLGLREPHSGGQQLGRRSTVVRLRVPPFQSTLRDHNPSQTRPVHAIVPARHRNSRFHLGGERSHHVQHRTSRRSLLLRLQGFETARLDRSPRRSRPQVHLHRRYTLPRRAFQGLHRHRMLQGDSEPSVECFGLPPRSHRSQLVQTRMDRDSNL